MLHHTIDHPEEETQVSNLNTNTWSYCTIKQHHIQAHILAKVYHNEHMFRLPTSQTVFVFTGPAFNASWEAYNNYKTLVINTCNN